ncbi:MAG: phosphoribosylformylglycinamidine synthase [Defluviitaleaceae bacterium]|nr:phosphoribosylformylglycinamidine synthase [Defluviitaleaceae bacterium]
MDNKIRRIYVERKPSAGTEGSSFFFDINNNLGIKNLQGARVLNCYDVAGISDEVYEKCIGAVFSEPPVDICYRENLPLSNDECAFGVKYLPGQYDQRADWAEAAIKIIMGEDEMDNICVVSSKFYVLKGQLNEEEIAKVKAYIINPVDSMECSLKKPESLKTPHTEPGDVEILNEFIDMQEDKLMELCEELGLAMSREDILHIHNYFKNTEKRDPTITEIKVLDTYWSDHCRHTTFLTNIEKVEIEDGKFSEPIKISYEEYLKLRKEVHGDKDKPVSLMDIAQMGMRYLKKTGVLKNLDESEEVNACSVKIKADINGKEEEWLLMFKNETHNHPTEIEPFGGASTCLGGAIRDPLSGRAYVYQAMRITGSGDPRTPLEETLRGKLPQRKITQEAARGYSSYGNQVGVASGLIHEIYDEGYVAKRMELGALVGAVPASHVVRERPSEGDVIILLGGETGRDGIGGATGSSKVQTDESIMLLGAQVQKGNAPTGRKIQRLFRDPQVTKLIKRCNDFGAGGVCVAIGELAEGLVVNLDKVPKKYEGLDGTELAISESQERMAVCVAGGDADEFIRLSALENLDAVVVADVNNSRRLVINWRGKSIVNISRDFLDTNGAKQYADVYIETPKAFTERNTEGASLVEKWLNNLADLNVCAGKGLSENFDSTVGAGTVLMPFGGKFQFTPALSMVSKLPVIEGDTTTASIMSFGFDPKLSKWSPYHGAMCAVIDSVAKIVATGGDPSKIYLSFQEYFERLRANPVRWGKPFAALLGALKAQLELGAASIGGKDSMSGSFNELDVPPTLVSFGVSHTHVDNIISPEFKNAGSPIFAVFNQFDDKGMPDFEYLRKLNKIVCENIANNNIISAHTIGFGGVSEALSKMAFGNRLGFNIELDERSLFSANYGGFVFELGCDKAKFESNFKDFETLHLGNTTEDIDFVINGKKINHFEALTKWLSTLESVFNTNLLLDIPFEDNNLEPLADAPKTFSKLGIAKPKVLIPAFPGTNCEYDTARAFEAAGAEVEIFVVQSLNAAQIKESCKIMAKKIENSQILALPGGFSAGDEPGGSGKFIAAAFRNEYIKNALESLLGTKDGLVIGICNGFQVLVKLGLLPHGEIRELNELSPTLTSNKIGRHVSSILNTKVISNKSPWLWRTKPGEIYRVAISHGEGRFLAKPADLEILKSNGQIATQYVDFDGNGANCFEFNPNGSTLAIEGITSPDGRVFGKMGHNERYTKAAFKNVPGNYEAEIFLSGVKYFA